MRVFLTLFMAFAILFSGLSAQAFGKKKKSAPTPIVPVPVETVQELLPVEPAQITEDSSEIITESEIKNEEEIKPVKEKKVKFKKEKIKKEKVKKQKTEKENAENEQQSIKEKTSKKKKTKASSVQTMPQMTAKQMREIQYVQEYYNSMAKNRSKLAMYLNPNLDIREVRASHILVKKRKDAVQIRKDILNGTITFEEAAHQYSLCPSAIYGGDLGYFDRKKMEQQFSDTAFDLNIGEISKPVGTKFGWHIIKTTDKR